MLPPELSTQIAAKGVEEISSERRQLLADVLLIHLFPFFRCLTPGPRLL
jgi:hypothetical protein